MGYMYIMLMNRNRTGIVSEDCNFPCLVLIAWPYRECLGELVHLSIRCSLLVCWLMCFLWEVTSRFLFYITKLRHCWSSNKKRAFQGGTFIFSSYVGLFTPKISGISDIPKTIFFEIRFQHGFRSHHDHLPADNSHGMLFPIWFLRQHQTLKVLFV